MKASLLRLTLLTLLCFALPGTASQKRPSFQKVMIVIFENVNYEDVVGLSFFSRLAASGALFTNFHAEAHPSQPNYIALIAGDTLGSKDDREFNTTSANITDLLDARGKTWKVYAEGYPGKCFLGMSHGTYVRKHNPFLSFRSIQTSPSKCSHIVNAVELAEDVRRNTVPEYSFYIPDMNNDGHDTSARYADAWYAKVFYPLLLNRNFMNGMLLVSTFDESDLDSAENHIYTSFYGATVQAGTKSNAPYDHYSLLRTIEEALGVGSLNRKDRTARLITDVWR